MYTIRKICRSCLSADLVDVFSFGKPMPLANSFKKEGEEQDGYVPLTVAFCEQCTLAQLRETVSPQILYSTYCYVTSTSETMRQHFRSLWKAIKDQGSCENVIEVGSNTGDFLAFAKENGAVSICGIDPAENLAAVAIRNGITTLIGVLDDYTAEIAHGVVPHADVIVARHVFAHIEDWHGFVKNLNTLSKRDTLIVLEVPWVIDTLKSVALDVLYHEHLSYVSVHSVVALLKGTLFHLHKVLHFPIHGGAIALMLRRNDHELQPDPSVQEFLAAENITAQTWEDFKNYANTSIRALRFTVDELKNSGRTICGFGASAKSTVWIAACGFTSKEIKFICDCTPQKQGKFSPGTDIPILSESALMERKPDYAVLFSWNFRDEILKKHKAYLDAGGHFIIPGKKLEII